MLLLAVAVLFALAQIWARALKRLTRLWVPAAAANCHDNLLKAFETQFAAVRDRAETMQTVNGHAALRCSQGFTSSVENLHQAMQEMTESTGYYARWPKPQATGVSDEANTSRNRVPKHVPE